MGRISNYHEVSAQRDFANPMAAHGLSSRAVMDVVRAARAMRETHNWETGADQTARRAAWRSFCRALDRLDETGGAGTSRRRYPTDVRRDASTGRIVGRDANRRDAS